MIHIIRILKGSDQIARIPFSSPANLNGFKAKMQIRRTRLSEEVLDELTTENGRISISCGAFILNFPHELTEEWGFRRGVFDIKALSPEGGEVRMAEGKIIAIPGVTR